MPSSALSETNHFLTDDDHLFPISESDEDGQNENNEVSDGDSEDDERETSYDIDLMSSD